MKKAIKFIFFLSLVRMTVCFFVPTSGILNVYAADYYEKTNDGINDEGTYLITIIAKNGKQYALGVEDSGKVIGVELTDISGDRISISDQRVGWIAGRETNGYSMRAENYYLFYENSYGTFRLLPDLYKRSNVFYENGKFYLANTVTPCYLGGVYQDKWSKFIFKLDNRKYMAGDIVLYKKLENTKEGKSSWEQIGDNWRYKDTDGSYIMNRWLKDPNGLWYHFDDNGLMQTGWIIVDDGTYYLYNNGAMASATILSIDGSGYEFDISGRLLPNDSSDPTRLELPEDMKEGTKLSGLADSVADDDWPLNWLNGKRVEGGKISLKRDNRLCVLAKECHDNGAGIPSLSQLVQMGAVKGMNFSHIAILRMNQSDFHPLDEYYYTNTGAREWINSDLMTHMGVYGVDNGFGNKDYIFLLASY